MIEIEKPRIETVEISEDAKYVVSYYLHSLVLL
jgi:hypothetical protein